MSRTELIALAQGLAADNRRKDAEIARLTVQIRRRLAEPGACQ
ncbi:hypothetical protein [Actinomadura formosensis]